MDSFTRLFVEGMTEGSDTVVLPTKISGSKYDLIIHYLEDMDIYDILENNSGESVTVQNEKLIKALDKIFKREPRMSQEEYKEEYDHEKVYPGKMNWDADTVIVYKDESLFKALNNLF